MPPVGPLPSVFVRPAAEEDVGFLVDLVVVVTRAQGRWPADLVGAAEQEWRAGFADWTRAQLRGEVDHSTTSVIEVDGALAGRLRVVRAPDHVELAGLQLLPAHQGHGIGTHLIEQVVVEARDAGLPCRLSVAHDNPRARALYERLGFTPTEQTDDEVLLRWSGSPHGSAG